MAIAMAMARHAILFLVFCILITTSYSTLDSIQRGFFASPEPSSTLQFQSLLVDPTSTFSLGFLRVDSARLDLAVVHLPSSFPLWRASPSRPFSWSSSTSLLFNGSLVLTDTTLDNLSWSTDTASGHELTLLSSSNLQVVDSARAPLWQSFDFPSDTLIQNQNFTSKSALISSNRQYSMKLGSNFLGLYIGEPPAAMYWKRTAMEVLGQIVKDQGPIYARLDPTGFLGLYQTESALVDVMPFDSFNAGTANRLRRLTLESDGNLRAYYSHGSDWVSEFEAISGACSLPATCGAYGVCYTDGPDRCRCLDNRTMTEGCFRSSSGNTCEANGFRVLRRVGVELGNQELIGFEKMGSLEECESSCEWNCSCWGAVYSNSTGHCYRIDYPIQTVIAVNDERKVGYFKIRDVADGGEDKRRERVAFAVAGVAILVCGCGFAGCRVWRNRGRRRAGDGGGAVPEGFPYKSLRSFSFPNIELTNSFRKE